MVDNVKKCAAGDPVACLNAEKDKVSAKIKELEAEKAKDPIHFNNDELNAAKDELSRIDTSYGSIASLLQGSLNGSSKKYTEADVDEANKKLGLDIDFLPTPEKLEKEQLESEHGFTGFAKRKAKLSAEMKKIVSEEIEKNPELLNKATDAAFKKMSSPENVKLESKILENALNDANAQKPTYGEI